MLTWRLEIAFGRKNMTCKTPTGWAFYHTRGVRSPFATFCKMFKCGPFVASYLILWVGISAKMFQVHYTGRNRLSSSISFKITPAKLKGGLPAPLSPILKLTSLGGPMPGLKDP